MKLQDPVLPAVPAGGADLLTCLRAAREEEDEVRGTLFEGAVLTGGDLYAAALRGCILRRCRLVECDLRRCQFEDVLLEECDFSGSRLDECRWSRCVFQGGKAVAPPSRGPGCGMCALRTAPWGTQIFPAPA